MPDSETHGSGINGAATSGRHCVLLFGGSFDPVHNGHVVLARLFMQIFDADLLRLIPAGNPWQKPVLQASAADRSEMLRLAFADQAMPFMIDQQEIERNGPSYSIDTVQAIRSKLGNEVCLIFIIGADQLVQLDSWYQWKELFDYVHLGVAARPGATLDMQHISPAVATEFSQRHGSREQVLASAHGLIYLLSDLAIDISSTAIRIALQTTIRSAPAAVPELPSAVLDYIQYHHLYQN
ncbi:MAG: nicotinate (nicotinamide) nucleotide adenylyltransferase [Herbaspirillum sp.]